MKDAQQQGNSKLIAGTSGVNARTKPDGKALSAGQMKKVCSRLQKVSGVSFAHDKQAAVARCMERRRMLTRKDSLAEYADFLARSPEEARALSEEVLAETTGFVRDPAASRTREENAIAEAARQTGDDCAEARDLGRAASRRIAELERELADAQTKLDGGIAEQNRLNGELQALDAEYRSKLGELAVLRDDIADLLSAAQTGVILVDSKLNIRRCTDYVTTAFSVTDHEIGRSLAFLSYHFPSADITEICANVLKTFVPDERELTANSGKSFFMRVAPCQATESKAPGCVITLMDRTAQRQSQASLRSTEMRLSMAEQASDARSEALRRIAHELRAPMSSLVSLTRSAKAQAGDRPALLAELDQIGDIVGYLSSIAGELSEASVSEQASGEQAREPFALRAVLDSVSAMLEPQLREAGARLEMTLEDSFDPQYMGGKTKLQQILMNFLGNSMRNTRAGGVIALRAYEKPFRGCKAQLCMVIADTGAAVAKERLPNLLKTFSGDGRSEDDATASLGLGLSNAYNLVTSMHGDVSVESKPGKGSTYTISVELDRPIGGEALVADAEADQSEERSLNGCHVLVVEDNALNRIILGAMLKHEGMTYVEALDGEEALKAYTSTAPRTFDCVFMDMRMPKLDGIRATQRIRESGREDALALPIIGVSSNGFPDDIQKARQAGIDDYVTKPVEREALLAAMSKLIKR